VEPRGIGAPFRQLLPTAPLREFATYFGVHQKTIRDGTLMIHGPTKSRRMRRVPLPSTPTNSEAAAPRRTSPCSAVPAPNPHPSPRLPKGSKALRAC